MTETVSMNMDKTSLLMIIRKQKLEIKNLKERLEATTQIAEDLKQRLELAEDDLNIVWQNVDD